MQGKKKKKKLNEGGSFLEEYKQPLQQGTILAGSMVKNEPLGGALKGAGAGMAVAGPVGGILGGLAGGILGLTNKRKRERELAELEDQQNSFEALQSRSNLIGNAALAKGGKLKKKLKLITGGELEPVSDEAVEVVADNPAMTDSVELDSAFVDNNEIIDSQDRVFSDDLMGPGGKKSIAAEAKALEKMKSDNSRFADSNSRVDSKLDQLFNYQESLKQDPTKPNPKGSYMERMLHKWDSVNNTETPFGVDRRAYLSKAYKTIKRQVVRGLNAEEMAAKQKPVLKPKKQDGGTIETLRPDLYPEEEKFDFQPLLTTAATFAPNLINVGLQRKLKGPTMPTFETQTTLERVSPEAQLSSARRAFNMAGESVRTGVAANNLASSTGSLLAKRIAGENQIYGQNQQINASIANQEAMLNQGVKARNTERVNRFKDDKVNFKNKKLQLTSENVSNLSGKILQLGREKNQMKRDSEALRILEEGYGDSGVLSRMSPEVMEALAKYRKQGKAKGGKLNKKKNS